MAKDCFFCKFFWLSEQFYSRECVTCRNLYIDRSHLALKQFQDSQPQDILSTDNLHKGAKGFLISQKDLMFDKPHLIFSTQTATTTGSVTLCMVTTVNMKMIIDEFQISFFFSVQTTLIACKRKRRMVLMDGDDDAEVSRIQPRWSFNFFFSVPLQENSFPVSSSQLSRGTMMKRRSTLTSRATSSTPRVNSRETQGDLIAIVLLKHRCTPHRFMVYWTTIVSTSYTTTYMDTSLIGIMWTTLSHSLRNSLTLFLATLKCTPSGFTLASSGCGR